MNQFLKTYIRARKIVKWYDYKIHELKSGLLSDDELVGIVRKYNYAIKHIDNPSEEVQLTAIKKDPYSIVAIENPFPSIIDRFEIWTGIKYDLVDIIKNHPYLLPVVKNPSEPVQLAAVERDGSTLYDILDKGIKPSEPVQLAAVKQNGNAIYYILGKGIEPSEPVQLAAVEKNTDVFDFIKNPFPSVIKKYEELTGKNPKNNNK